MDGRTGARVLLVVLAVLVDVDVLRVIELSPVDVLVTDVLVTKGIVVVEV